MVLKDIVISTATQSRQRVSSLSKRDKYASKMNQAVLRAPVIFRRNRQFENSISIFIDSPENRRSIIPTTDESRVHKGIFNGIYMEAKLKETEKIKWDLSFSDIADYFPTDRDARLFGCSCCLCTLRNKNGDTFEFCIKKHPFEQCCQRDQPKPRNNSTVKYQKQKVCNQCMFSITSSSKRTKTKGFCCSFQSCSLEFKTRTALQNHYLKHLNVKKFSCNVCEKDYASKSGLKKHERKH